MDTQPSWILWVGGGDTIQALLTGQKLNIKRMNKNLGFYLKEHLEWRLEIGRERKEEREKGGESE